MFRRYLSQGEEMTDITGAHSRANTVITNYLLEGCGIEIEDEVVLVDGEEFHVLGITVLDVQKTLSSVITLLQTVQRIKSTGDTFGCKNLFDKYINYPTSLEQARIYRNYMLANKRKLVGNIKAISRLYPKYTPVLDKFSNIVDVVTELEDVFEQNFNYDRLTLSKYI
jgi:hypothetical protein